MRNTREFIRFEIIGANLLLIGTILALILSNSPWNKYYENFFQQLLPIPYFKINLLFLINEGLMTLFFLVVGLEIKQELLEGALNSFSKALLPGLAAVGGMIVPALIYIKFNYHDVSSLRGWAIPTATDIAFALSILSLLGRRVPSGLQAFLAALAILDDLAAIIIIAIFYTNHISFYFLTLTLLLLVSLYILNLKEIKNLVVYGIIGCILWVCLYKAGISPILAGIILAFSIPLNYSKSYHNPYAAKKITKFLHFIVASGVVPLFAFANAGVSFLNPPEEVHFFIIFGILGGLFLGKQIGVFGACWLAVKLRIAELPSNVGWSQLYGMSVLCGIGFTISLFIGTLPFGHASGNYLYAVKIGVLSGSLLSGIVGYFLLKRSIRE